MTSNIFAITMLLFLMYTDISPEYVGMFMMYFHAKFLMPSSKDSLSTNMKQEALNSIQ